MQVAVTNFARNCGKLAVLTAPSLFKSRKKPIVGLITEGRMQKGSKNPVSEIRSGGTDALVRRL